MAFLKKKIKKIRAGMKSEGISEGFNERNTTFCSVFWKLQDISPISQQNIGVNANNIGHILSK